MLTDASATSITLPAVAARAGELLLRHQRHNWKRIDHLFAGLLACEWLAGILLALCRTPRTWDGASSSIHPHLLSAVLYGGAIVALPIFLAIFHPARVFTRQSIAIAQPLMSALFIHLGDGRIEMHFHVFGSLAFLAFYRDWRVLITASAVVAMDHLLRGMFAPLSVYGTAAATLWRTAEHAGWVIFEDIFLIASCVKGVREMHGIAENRAMLEHSFQTVEEQVRQRTAQLKDAQDELVEVARSAGMAEIATSVLHNVGNVLNSVNVSANVLTSRLKQSELASLTKVSEMIRENESQLDAFLCTDERGKLIPGFIVDLAACLGDEQNVMLHELQALSAGVDHIKQIVAAQQSMAKKSNVQSVVDPAKLIETALDLKSSSLNNIEIVKRTPHLAPVPLDQHKVLQILVNLIGNAAEAVRDNPKGQRRIELSIEPVEADSRPFVRFKVTDNGVGIAPENLARIFSFGFTTKKDGHGFGLHSAVNAAGEMRGSLTAASGGMNQGSTFTLDVPVAEKVEGEQCSK